MGTTIMEGSDFNTGELLCGALLQGGRYKIIKTLGRGGFGITYLAEQSMMKRNVCIKEFFPKGYYKRDSSTCHVSPLSNSIGEMMEKYKVKFVKEAQTIAELDHPNIISIFDIFEENSTAYYVMEYIDGESLKGVVDKRGFLDNAEAKVYIEQLAQALECIHGQKINHLDVKPSNVMVRSKDNRAILIDFGLSKHYDDDGHQTSSTPVGVSHGYAPIEQYSKEGVTTFSPETDIYSLGATLYYIVIGHEPPQATDIGEDGIGDFPAYVSGDIRNAIERAMEYRRKSRPHSVAEFMSLLNQSYYKEVNDENTIIVEPEPESTIIHHNDSITIDSGEHLGHSYVDLGLSVMWATCNVGATQSEEKGDYFAWGETFTKKEYLEENCSTLLPILKNKSLFRKSIVAGYKGINIDDIAGYWYYDAAYANWGGNWRMPRASEIEELIYKCRWEYNGKGYKVLGPNGKSIFLPMSGSSHSIHSIVQVGCYWSSSPPNDKNNTQGAQCLYLKGNSYELTWNFRYRGYAIRPVLDK